MESALYLLFFALPTAALAAWAFYFRIRKAVAHGILDAEQGRVTGARAVRTPSTRE